MAQALLMEKQITFDSDDLRLHGLLHTAGNKGVVVTHPHPLYGGDMHNPVVEAITHAFQHHGYTTLRFNFRGVGQSQGMFDEGLGEKQDVCRAMSYLENIGIEKYCLAGYSFGAWVNAQILPEEMPDAEMIMVSPPVAFMGFESVQAIPKLKLVVTGGKDDIAPAQMIKKMLPAWCATTRLEIITGADHFYSGHTGTLSLVVQKAVSSFKK